MRIEGSTLYKIRRTYRLTLMEVGLLADVSAAYIHQIENGKRPASDSVSEKLAEELDLTPDKLARILSIYDSLTDEVARGSTHERISGFQSIALT